MDKMAIWDAVKQPPKSALKQIGGGRLKGMTDINPQWRYQVMTEQFGICGIGWKYTINRVWSESTPDGQVFAFAEITLFIKLEEVWRDSIPGIGGSMLISKEASGLHTNDEAYKMAITDALSVAMKMLGVGADIYAGLWDGTKYKDDGGQAAMPKEKAKAGELITAGELIKVAETVAREALEGKAMEAEQPHFCKEHQVKFFKSGKMTSYAHPVGRPEEKLPWCHEHKAEVIPATGKPPEPTESDKAFDALKSAAKPETGPSLTFKDFGDVGAAALKLGISTFALWDRAAIKLGKPIKKWQDVGTMAEAWALIQEMAAEKTKKEATPHGN